MNPDLILKVVVSILVLSPLVIAYIKKLVDKAQDEKLRELILTFVEAADQMLKAVDPTGEKRKEYVLKSLHELNIEWSPYIDALIEQAVLGLWYYQPNKEISTEEKENTYHTIMNDTSM